MKISKRIWSLLLALCLVVTQMPAMALAGEIGKDFTNDSISGVYVSGKKLTPERYYTTDTDGNIIENGSIDNYNVFLTSDGGGYTLTLNNATINDKKNSEDSSDQWKYSYAGIYYSGKTGEPLEIVLKGENTVTSTADNTFSYAAGIWVKNQSLTIRGDGGKLLTYSDTSVLEDDGNRTNQSYGIRVEGTDAGITFNEGVTVTAISGNSESNNYAVFSEGDINIKNATIYANCSEEDKSVSKAGSALSNYTCGIWANGEMKIEESNVYAYGGKALDNGAVSWGIFSTNGIEVNGGEVKAYGDETWGSSFGIGSLNNISIHGDAAVVAEGSGATSYSYGIRAGADITISENAVVNATGGEADYSYGIGANNNITISGSADITAKSGNGRTDSYGIGADGNITVNGGTVHAVGKAATENLQSGSSYGIGSGGNITVNDGTITATSEGSSSGSSFGIGATYDPNTSTASTGGSITVYGGTVNANGGISENGDSYGIGANGDISINDGIVNSNGGTSKNNNSYGVGTDGNFNIIKGTVNANGGNAAIGSFGIGTQSNVNATGGVVNATGGTGAQHSLGIGADYYINVNGATINAKGDKRAMWSRIPNNNGITINLNNGENLLFGIKESDGSRTPYYSWGGY